MKTILLPVDGSQRSQISLEAVRQIFPPEETEVTVLTVAGSLESAGKEAESLQMLADCAAKLRGYTVKTVFLRGVPGAVIVNFAKEKAFDAIVMTRSSRGPLHNKLGSVTNYVAKHANDVNLIILQEETRT